MKTVEITFNVQGHIKQRAVLSEGVDPQRLLSLLREGEAFTTIQEGGNIEVVKTGEVLGRVVLVENECEYDEFELENCP